MGMYTELHFNAELIKNPPKQVIDTLHYMTGQGEHEPVELPNHPLFKDSRWAYMLQSSSYYFPMSVASSIDFDDIAKAHYLRVRCNLKDYDDEIKNFLDWVMPYVDADTECLGYHRYEDDDHPTLIYKRATAQGRPATETTRAPAETARAGTGGASAGKGEGAGAQGGSGRLPGGPVATGHERYPLAPGEQIEYLAEGFHMRLREISDALAAHLGIDTSPCDCVTTETTPSGQITPRTFNIDMSGCDRHRKDVSTT